MLRLRTLLTRSLAPAALCALAVAACGGSSQHPETASLAASTAKTSVRDKTLYIYSGLPHSGPLAAESQQIEQGIRFVLDGAKHQAGEGYTVRYTALSDTSPPPSRKRSKRRAAPSHGGNQMATVRAAERAARNPETVAYIGDLNSGATELSLPILNQAGIVQLTPGSGYPGLTDSVQKVTLPTEPRLYYPQGKRSLLRLVPNDLVQAAAATYWLKKYTSPSCERLAAVAFGGGQESTALVNAVANSARSDGLTFVPTEPPGTDTKKYPAYVQSVLVQHQVNCLVVAGTVSRAAVEFTNDFHAGLPGAFVVGTSGLCNPRWSDPARGGVSAKVDPFLYCMTSALPLKYYAGGTYFGAKYRAAHHKSATAYTYYGYLAANLVLQAISDIGPEDSRQQVMSNLVGNVASTGFPAAYTFDSDGDPTGKPAATEYGIEKIDEHGIPRFAKVLPGT
jgi:branched-chain amino acid transport system substrate-binding protein